MDASQPIGIFDSGIGGLSVFREIQNALPDEALLYVADQAHVPYGQRPLEEIREFSRGITRFLLEQNAKLIVVACNTASAASLFTLRASFTSVSFVGLEPALKPAAEVTKSGKVGVLATPATFQGQLYASLVDRFAQNLTIYQDACPGLVELIEAGKLDTPQTRQILEYALLPMLAAGVDTIVLGCTHYPFVIPLIQTITGEQVRVINPAPAVARQVRRVLEKEGILAFQTARQTQKPRFWTSADPQTLTKHLNIFLGGEGLAGKVIWKNGDLEIFHPSAEANFSPPVP